jgi:hypothetical protein
MQMQEIDVNNPLNQSEHCRLFNKRADPMYYTHRYDPGPILERLSSRLFQHFPSEVLDRFVREPQEGCCNAISITLYITQCNASTLKKYLYSIHRSVKNVLKKLPDWIVRLYLDTSVEECVQEFGDFTSIFNAIKDSPNVEVYTYDCPSFKKDAPPATKIPIARTRTLRFLPLSDPDVNFCVVREADGIVSNLDCHNIKMFASNPNILFYLPVVKIYRTDLKFDSYATWLQLYKVLFEYDFFNEYQNITDFLAGAFCCRLKLKREYYIEITRSLQERINGLFVINPSGKVTLNEHLLTSNQLGVPLITKFQITLSDFIKQLPKQALNLLAIGFDEIILLAIYKECISLKFVCSDERRINWAATKEVEDQISAMVIADNILTFGTKAVSETWQDIVTIYYELVENQIIHSLVVIPSEQKTFEKFLLDKIGVDVDVDAISRTGVIEYYIDAMLLGNIIAKIPFNIIVSPMANEKTYVSALLNMPYSSTFDMFYDDTSVVGFSGGNRKRQNFSRKNNNKNNKNNKKKRQSRYRIKKRIITRRTSTSCKCK